MFTFFKQHKKLFLTLVFIVGGIFLVPAKNATALEWSALSIFTHPGETAVLAVGKIVQYYVQAIGWLVVMLIGILIKIAQYNNFVNSGAVENGWVIIRDVVNMFFIVILLVIAFATIFNVKEYKYQAMLPRLLIMAVVINFSRTICGILIDFGQVVMLTFVNGFQAAAGGNFVNALKIDKLLKFNPQASPGTTSLGYVFAAFILAAIVITVTLVVLVVMVMMLIMRIVALWFLIVLSPIAFLASVWPSGRLKQNYAKWWDMFLDNIIVGPLLAFFLWLSLLVLGQGTINTEVTPSGTGELETEMFAASSTEIGKFDNMVSYLMGIGMLLGSLAMAQGMRSAGAGIAGAALGKIKQYSTAAVKRPTVWAGKKAYGRAKRTTRNAAVGALSGLSAIPGFGRLVPTKVLGGLRQAQQKQAQEDSSYIASLTPKDRERLTRRLETSPFQTDKTKNRLGALYKERLGDLGRESWKPDGKNAAGEDIMKDKATGKEHTKSEWYKGKQDETAKIESFSEARASRDPDFRKKVKEFEDTRIDFLQGRTADQQDLSKTDLGRAAAAMDSLKAASLSTKILQNDEVIEALGQKNRDYIIEHGGQARKDLVEAWEKRHGKGGAKATPSPTPGGGAREVELEGGEELELAQTPEEVLEKKQQKNQVLAEEYKDKEREYLDRRNEEIAKRAEENYQKRLAGQEQGFTYAEIDQTLKDVDITPGTPEADKYMRQWDKIKARADVEAVPESVSGYEEYKKAEGAWVESRIEVQEARAAVVEQKEGASRPESAGQPTAKTTPPTASATPQEKIDFVAQGGPVENVYQVDASGNFNDDAAAGQFKNDWTKFKEVISKEQVEKLFSALSGLKGQMAGIALKSLNVNNFRQHMMMMQRMGMFGKGGADEKNLKKIIRKYMSETEGSKDSPEVKETREYIENNSVTNQYISEGEEEEKKA